MRDKTVLVIDDDEIITKYVRNLLEESTLYKVIIKYNGKQAIEYLTEHGDVDLIITDYKMPQMDGNEFLKILRNSDLDSSTLPVIFLTAYEDKEKWREVNNKIQPAVAYIVKPLEPELFLSTVARALIEQEAMEHEFDRIYIERQKDFFFADQINSGELIVSEESKEFLTGGILKKQI